MDKEQNLKRIGAVSKQLKIASYVLRYWEMEFPELKPLKSSSGQRLYSEKDIEIIKKIARLRYDEKVTLKGTKQKMQTNDEPERVVELKKSLQHVKNSLQEILAALG